MTSLNKLFYLFIKHLQYFSHLSVDDIKLINRQTFRNTDVISLLLWLIHGLLLLDT